MSYYGQGDFYGRGGNYYRGDPGFFSFLGKVGKGIANVATGALGLGPVFAPKVSTAVKAVEAAPAAAGRAMSVVKAATGIIKKHPTLSAAGAAGLGGIAAGAAGSMTTMALKKSGTLFGGQRKHRRMNPCNPRALRRAIRRARSFEHLAKSVIGFSSPRKPHGRMYFKKKRRK